MNTPYGQMPNVNMTPDLMYNIINSNPGIKNAMEQAVKLQYMQQQAQQLAPMLQQMAQNPSDAMNGFVNWQQQQQQPIQNPQKEPEKVQSPQEQALAQFNTFMESVDKMFDDMRAGLTEIHSKCSSNEAALAKLLTAFGEEKATDEPK